MSATGFHAPLEAPTLEVRSMRPPLDTPYRLYLPSTPLSYGLLRPLNVLWEQGVASSNLAVPITVDRLVDRNPFTRYPANTSDMTRW